MNRKYYILKRILIFVSILSISICLCSCDKEIELDEYDAFAQVWNEKHPNGTLDCSGWYDYQSYSMKVGFDDSVETTNNYFSGNINLTSLDYATTNRYTFKKIHQKFDKDSTPLVLESYDSNLRDGFYYERYNEGMTPDVPVLKKTCGCKYSKSVYIDFGIKNDFLNPEKYKDYIANDIYQAIVIHDNFKQITYSARFVSMNSTFENEYYKETYLANLSFDENYQILEIFITYTKTYFKEILNGEAYKSIISRKRLRKGSEVKIEVSSKYDEELLFDNDLLICL